MDILQIKVYIIGSLSQVEQIESAAKYYSSFFKHEVRYVKPEPDKPLMELIEKCYKDIMWADIVYVVQKPDGTVGEGVQHEIVFANIMNKRVEMVDPTHWTFKEA